jgi:hypothetical protein
LTLGQTITPTGLRFFAVEENKYSKLVFGWQGIKKRASLARYV